jgi:hypothetical protein
VENPFRGEIQWHLCRVEKQSVTEFFSDERMPEFEIVRRLMDYYDEESPLNS